MPPKAKEKGKTKASAKTKAVKPKTAAKPKATPKTKPRPTKDAVAVAIDCGGSMKSHLEVAKKVAMGIIAKEFLGGASNEVGIVLFGLPEDQTDNALNKEDPDQYVGVKELNMIEKPRGAMMKTLMEDVVASPEDVTGDPLDAIVVAQTMLRDRTSNKQYNRHVYLVTLAADELDAFDAALSDLFDERQANVAELSDLEGIAQLFRQEKCETALHLMSIDLGSAEEGSVKSENEKMLGSLVTLLGGVVADAAQYFGDEVPIKMPNPQLKKMKLCMGAKLALNCTYMIKMKENPAECLKKESTRSTNTAGKGGEVKQERRMIDPEDSTKDVPFSDRTDGFKYEMPVLETLKNLKYRVVTDESSMALLGFVGKAEVPRHYYLRETLTITAALGDQQAEQGLAAFVEACRRSGKVAVVRFLKVFRGEAKPTVGILLPHHKESTFTFHTLPFAEDLRDYTFPSFLSKQRAPTDEQVDVTRKLVDALHCPAHGSGSSFELVPNPHVQRVNKAVLDRLVNPAAPIPPLPPSILERFNPPADIMARAAPTLGDYTKLFPLKKKQAGAFKKKRKHWSDQDPDKILEVEEQEQKRSKTEIEEGGQKAAAHMHVGTTSPVDNFQKMVGTREPEAVSRAFQQMKDVIEQYAGKAINAVLYDKACDCLEALRSASVAAGEGESSAFNVFLTNFRNRFIKGKPRLWQVVKEHEILPINDSDAAGMGLTPENAKEWMDGEKAAPETSPMQAEEENDSDDGLA